MFVSGPRKRSEKEKVVLSLFHDCNKSRMSLPPACLAIWSCANFVTSFCRSFLFLLADLLLDIWKSCFHLNSDLLYSSLWERSLVVSNLRSANKGSRVKSRLAICRGELSAVITQLMPKCL